MSDYLRRSMSPTSLACSTRVASLVRRRGFNIESLTVGHAGTPGLSRMTLVVEANPSAAARIEANLYRLVDVRSVENVTDVPTVFRHLALIKVAASAESRSQVMQLVDVFRARVVDVAPGLAHHRDHRRRREDRRPARDPPPLRRARSRQDRMPRDDARRHRPRGDVSGRGR